MNGCISLYCNGTSERFYLCFSSFSKQLNAFMFRHTFVFNLSTIQQNKHIPLSKLLEIANSNMYKVVHIVLGIGFGHFVQRIMVRYVCGDSE